MNRRAGLVVHNFHSTKSKWENLMSFSSPRPMVNRVSRGNPIPFVTPSSAMKYDWIMPAKSPCLLNRNNQYNGGFISSTGLICRPLSSAEGLARIFHELLSRDHETGNPLAGLSGAQRARIRWACLPATCPLVPRSCRRVASAQARRAGTAISVVAASNS
jgi:hypothetical protein